MSASPCWLELSDCWDSAEWKDRQREKMTERESEEESKRERER